MGAGTGAGIGSAKTGFRKRRSPVPSTEEGREVSPVNHNTQQGNILMPTYHVSIAFAQLRDTDLLDFAGAVLAGLTDNPIFPTPPVSLADLAETKTDFARALTAAATGGPQTTAAKNIVRATLGNMLRKEAYYVQSMMNNDLSVLLATGFQATSTNRARSPLPTPSVVRIDNEHATGDGADADHERPRLRGAEDERHGRLDHGRRLHQGATHRDQEPGAGIDLFRAGPRGRRQHRL
jgi:hypothetical protein